MATAPRTHFFYASNAAAAHCLAAYIDQSPPAVQQQFLHGQTWALAAPCFAETTHDGKLFRNEEALNVVKNTLADALQAYAMANKPKATFLYDVNNEQDTALALRIRFSAPAICVQFVTQAMALPSPVACTLHTSYNAWCNDEARKVLKSILETSVKTSVSSTSSTVATASAAAAAEVPQTPAAVAEAQTPAAAEVAPTPAAAEAQVALTSSAAAEAQVAQTPAAAEAQVAKIPAAAEVAQVAQTPAAAAEVELTSAAAEVQVAQTPAAAKVQVAQTPGAAEVAQVAQTPAAAEAQVAEAQTPAAANMAPAPAAAYDMPTAYFLAAREAMMVVPPSFAADSVRFRMYVAARERAQFLEQLFCLPEQWLRRIAVVFTPDTAPNTVDCVDYWHVKSMYSDATRDGVMKVLSWKPAQ